MPRDPNQIRSIRLDQIDLLILSQVQSDCRITNAALAQQIGISPPSTLERVRKLEEHGYIRGYVALLDRQRLEKHITALVEITLAEHSTDNLAHAKQSLASLQEVVACWQTTGDHDFVLHVIVHDLQSYETFITEKLSTAATISRIRTSIVIRTVKETTQIPLDSIKPTTHR